MSFKIGIAIGSFRKKDREEKYVKSLIDNEGILWASEDNIHIFELQPDVDYDDTSPNNAFVRAYNEDNVRIFVTQSTSNQTLKFKRNFIDANIMPDSILISTASTAFDEEIQSSNRIWRLENNDRKIIEKSVITFDKWITSSNKPVKNIIIVFQSDDIYSTSARRDMINSIINGYKSRFNVFTYDILENDYTLQHENIIELRQDGFKSSLKLLRLSKNSVIEVPYQDYINDPSLSRTEFEARRIFPNESLIVPYLLNVDEFYSKMDRDLYDYDFLGGDAFSFHGSDQTVPEYIKKLRMYSVYSHPIEEGSFLYHKNVDNQDTDPVIINYYTGINLASEALRVYVPGDIKHIDFFENQGADKTGIFDSTRDILDVKVNIVSTNVDTGKYLYPRHKGYRQKPDPSFTVNQQGIQTDATRASITSNNLLNGADLLELTSLDVGGTSRQISEIAATALAEDIQVFFGQRSDIVRSEINGAVGSASGYNNTIRAFNNNVVNKTDSEFFSGISAVKLQNRLPEIYSEDIINSSYGTMLAYNNEANVLSMDAVTEASFIVSLQQKTISSRRTSRDAEVAVLPDSDIPSYSVAAIFTAMFGFNLTQRESILGHTVSIDKSNQLCQTAGIAAGLAHAQGWDLETSVVSGVVCLIGLSRGMTEYKVTKAVKLFMSCYNVFGFMDRHSLQIQDLIKDIIANQQLLLTIRRYINLYQKKHRCSKLDVLELIMFWDNLKSSEHALKDLKLFTDNSCTSIIRLGYIWTNPFDSLLIPLYQSSDNKLSSSEGRLLGYISKNSDSDHQTEIKGDNVVGYLADTQLLGTVPMYRVERTDGIVYATTKDELNNMCYGIPYPLDTFDTYNMDILSVLPLPFMGAEGVSVNGSFSNKGKQRKGSDCWGWTDSNGHEYAIMTVTNGTAFINISDPQSPYLVGFLKSTGEIESLWHDVKVYKDFAYIVSESDNHGMQVFDLKRLQGLTGRPQLFEVDYHYTDFGSAHNIWINEESGYAYIAGITLNTSKSGIHVVDLSNPAMPVLASASTEIAYSHDFYSVIYNGPDEEYQGREILWSFDEDSISCLDVTDKNNIVLLSTAKYLGYGYVHQGCLTENHKYLLSTDELDELETSQNTTLYVWDYQALESPKLKILLRGPGKDIDHNVYVRDNKAYLAGYGAGLTVLDLTVIDSFPTEEEPREIDFDDVLIGKVDTFPENDDIQDAVFDGAWSCYPYYSSNITIISDIKRGLFVVKESPQ